jgi:hypothetical protein
VHEYFSSLEFMRSCKVPVSLAAGIDRQAALAALVFSWVATRTIFIVDLRFKSWYGGLG